MRFVPALLLVASVASVASVGEGAAGCGAEVRPGASARSSLGADAGLSRAMVDEVVTSHLPAIRACYEDHAKAEGRPMGVVRVGWQIEPAGAVGRVEIVSTTLRSSAIEGCITREVARWTFPTSSRPTSVAEHPFTF